MLWFLLRYLLGLVVTSTLTYGTFVSKINCEISKYLLFPIQICYFSKITINEFTQFYSLLSTIYIHFHKSRNIGLGQVCVRANQCCLLTRSTIIVENVNSNVGFKIYE